MQKSSVFLKHIHIFQIMVLLSYLVNLLRILPLSSIIKSILMMKFLGTIHGFILYFSLCSWSRFHINIFMACHMRVVYDLLQRCCFLLGSNKTSKLSHQLATFGPNALLYMTAYLVYVGFSTFVFYEIPQTKYWNVYFPVHF